MISLNTLFLISQNYLTQINTNNIMKKTTYNKKLMKATIFVVAALIALTIVAITNIIGIIFN